MVFVLQDQNQILNEDIEVETYQFFQFNTVKYKTNEKEYQVLQIYEVTTTIRL